MHSHIMHTKICNKCCISTNICITKRNSSKLIVDTCNIVLTTRLNISSLYINTIYISNEFLSRVCKIFIIICNCNTSVSSIINCFIELYRSIVFGNVEISKLDIRQIHLGSNDTINSNNINHIIFNTDIFNNIIECSIIK